MKTKKPWTRAEMALLAMPLIIAMAAGVAWKVKQTAPIAIEIANVNDIAFSPDGRHLMATNYGAKAGVSIFDARTGALQARLQKVWPSGSSLNSLSWSPDSDLVAAHYLTGQIGNAANRNGGSIVFNSLGAPMGLYRNGVLTPFNSLSNIAIWNTSDGTIAKKFALAPTNEHAIGRLIWDSSGKLWNSESPPSLFDVHKGRRVRRFGPVFIQDEGQSPYGTLSANHTLLAISKAGKTSKNGGEVWIYQVSNGQLLQKLKTPTRATVTWSPDADVCKLSWNMEGTTALHWQLFDARTGRSFANPMSVAKESSFLGYQGHVAIIFTKADVLENDTASWQRLMMRDFRHGKKLWEVGSQRAFNADFREVSFSPDGRRLSALDWMQTSGQGSTRIAWDVASGTEIWRHQVPDDQLDMKLKWAPDGRTVALFGKAGIRIIQLPQ